jgi:hypothetical protein
MAVPMVFIGVPAIFAESVFVQGTYREIDFNSKVARFFLVQHTKTTT